MNEMYNAEETDSILLADAKNAFNSVNKSFFVQLMIPLSFYFHICEKNLQCTIKGCLSKGEPKSRQKRE